MYNQPEVALEKYELTVSRIIKGRGAYICNNIQCLEKVIKTKRLEKALGLKITEEVYSNLKNIINGGEFIG